MGAGNAILPNGVPGPNHQSTDARNYVHGLICKIFHTRARMDRTSQVELSWANGTAVAP